MKFKAAILFECKKPLLIEEISLNPLKEGQVLIKIFETGICRSQIFEIDGERGEDKWLPHLLGHEAIGEVVEVGKSVKKLKIGDKVIASWIRSEGISAEPAKYSLKDKVIHGGQITTFSEYSICSENTLIPFSEKFAHSIGPTLGCAIPTGYGITITEKRVKNAKYIGISGLGGIGISALIGCKNNSESKVVGIDINEFRLKEALKLGSNFIANPRKVNLSDYIHAITDGQMLDILIEWSGSIVGLNNSLRLINNSGLVKFATHPKFGDYLNIDPFELIKGKKIEGSWGGGIQPDKDLPVMINDLKSNDVFIRLINQEKYSLNNINKAIKEMREGKVLRPILKMN